MGPCLRGSKTLKTFKNADFITDDPNNMLMIMRKGNKHHLDRTKLKCSNATQSTLAHYHPLFVTQGAGGTSVKTLKLTIYQAASSCFSAG